MSLRLHTHPGIALIISWYGAGGRVATQWQPHGNQAVGADNMRDPLPLATTVAVLPCVSPFQQDNPWPLLLLLVSPTPIPVGSALHPITPVTPSVHPAG